MKKKWGFFIILITMGVIFTGEKVHADTVTVSSPEELATSVNLATEERTIVLSDSFPEIISSKIELKENSSYPVTIDGNSRTLKPSSDNEIINYQSGTSMGGNLIIKNINFQGEGSSNRAANFSSYKGQVTLENILVNDFHKGDDGGALYFAYNANIKNSTISNNSSNQQGYSGGAISGSKGYSGFLNIENSKFYNNETLALGTGPVGGEGGALYFYSPSNSAKFTFKNNYFYGNKAVENANDLTTGKKTLADGGAVALFNVISGTEVLFEGNTFDSNIAGDNGGAVLIQTNSNINEGISFVNNTFYKNIAKSDSTLVQTQSGGAIQIYGNGSPNNNYAATVNFENNTFASNEALTEGGAVGLANYETNTTSGIFKNNIFVDNKSNDLNTASISSSGRSTDYNNVGYDNGVANAVSSEYVFGALNYGLVSNQTEIQAGSIDTQVYIPTIPIAPEKNANRKVSTEDTLTTDQRGYSRTAPSDIGAVEIYWIKYDSNGGTFNFSTLPNQYDGLTYYDNTKTTAYYQVGTKDITKTITEGVSALGAEKSNSTFLGWSTDKNATLPDTDYAEGKDLSLSEKSRVLYAVWQETVAGADVTVHYTDTDGNTIAPDVVESGNIGDSYTTEQLAIDGYTFKEVQGNATGMFTADPQEVTYIYQKDIKVGGNVTVEYWEYDSNGTPVKKIHDDTIITGNVGERYHAEAYYVTGYGFSGVNTKTGLSPISGLITAEAQTVKLIYHKLNDESTEGLV
ncbi:MucBP domain-containing protein, partial [Enterococcus sp. ALS3]